MLESVLDTTFRTEQNSEASEAILGMVARISSRSATGQFKDTWSSVSFAEKSVKRESKAEADAGWVHADFEKGSDWEKMQTQTFQSQL